jgi:signal transduction histidine kinase
MANHVDRQRGRVVARLLEPYRAEILTSYQAALERAGSDLLRSEGTREQVLGHADQTLTDVFRALRTGVTVWARQPEVVDLGRSRATARVHPSESMRAAGLLYEVTAQAFARALRDVDDPEESLVLVLGILGSRMIFGANLAANSYLGVLLEYLNTAHVDERRRVSRELHDRVAHGVNGAYRTLEVAELYLETDPERAASKMRDAKAALVETLERIREVMAGLRTGMGTETLKAALEKYVEMADPPKPATIVSVVGNESWMLPEAREELYLTLREAVRNVIHHARARSLEVRVHITPYEADCMVIDDGIGFDPGEGSATPRHIGLLSMRERVELLRGEFAVETGPDLGTRLQIIVPLMGIQDADHKG